MFQTVQGEIEKVQKVNLKNIQYIWQFNITYGSRELRYEASELFFSSLLYPKQYLEQCQVGSELLVTQEVTYSPRDENFNTTMRSNAKMSLKENIW